MNSSKLALIASLALCACATSRVQPVPQAALLQEKRICVLENPRVRAEFLDAYRAALSGRGYDVVVLKKAAPADHCPLTSRYTAHWAWDMVLYLSYAELNVYRDGAQAGRAEFRARGSRFIDAETKVKELVNQLLPE